MTIDKNLKRLRELMRENDIDIYIVPTADFHQSEYVGEYFKSRMFISGFTGSSGTAVITLDEAGLWTDGRYFIQAEKQLESSSFTLFKMGEPGVPTIIEFLKERLGKNNQLGFDGRVVSVSEGLAYENLAKLKGSTIIYEMDLVDRVWDNRPSLSSEPAFFLEEKYSGESTKSKLGRIREMMNEYNVNKHLITSLDDIAWTLNIRGDDIEFFPLVLSYLVITTHDAYLYIDKNKLDKSLVDTLYFNGVKFIKDYKEIYEDMKSLKTTDIILLDPTRVNYALYKNIPDHTSKVEKVNPTVLFKSIKNKIEVENMKIAQIKDSVAHIKFMKWIKENVGRIKISEISASNKLNSYREENESYIRPSFEPISSFGENAAIVHYSPSQDTDKLLEKDGLFLTDTGGGYYEGSTDITRTYATGNIPQAMKDDFTLVLKAHINLSKANFLHGCNGMNLDILARGPFWDRDLNFNHGTGHGMGYLMNIHEDPIGFRWKYSESEGQQFEEGMIITNEPWYLYRRLSRYQTGK